MLEKLKNLCRKISRSIGYEVIAYNYRRIHDLRKIKLLNDLNISVVIDVGANRGQFASKLRRLGYKNKIVSFEPIPFVYQELVKNTQSDPKWITANFALGEIDGNTVINIAKYDPASSILQATGAAITGEYTQTYPQIVPIRRLDSIALEYIMPMDRIYLKIDTQGYEKYVLNGAHNTLSQVVALDVEVSTIKLYNNECLFHEMIELITQLNFGIFSIDTVLLDHITGRCLQFEILCIRNDLNF